MNYLHSLPQVIVEGFDEFLPILHWSFVPLPATGAAGLCFSSARVDCQHCGLMNSPLTGRRPFLATCTLLPEERINTKTVLMTIQVGMHLACVVGLYWRCCN